MSSPTATVTSLITTTITVVSSAASASSTLRATPQGGILEGAKPNAYLAANPIQLFIIQVCLSAILPTYRVHPVQMPSAALSPSIGA
jgi:hypothetical protein